jgi:hypothetical protein
MPSLSVASVEGGAWRAAPLTSRPTRPRTEGRLPVPVPAAPTDPRDNRRGPRQHPPPHGPRPAHRHATAASCAGPPREGRARNTNRRAPQRLTPPIRGAYSCRVTAQKSGRHRSVGIGIGIRIGIGIGIRIGIGIGIGVGIGLGLEIGIVYPAYAESPPPPFSPDLPNSKHTSDTSAHSRSRASIASADIFTPGGAHSGSELKRDASRSLSSTAARDISTGTLTTTPREWRDPRDPADGPQRASW